MKRLNISSTILPPLAVLLSVLFIMEALVRGSMLPVTIPAPSAVVAEFWDSAGDLFYHLGPSVIATGSGFLIASLIAAVLAALAVSWRAAEEPVFNLGILIDSTPLIAIAPIIVAFIGTGMILHVTVAAVASLFPLLVGMLQGFKATDKHAQELFHVIAASRWQRLRLLAVPSALPYVFAAGKIAAPLAVLGTLIAEMMGAERGIGIMMIYALFSFDVPLVWLTIVSVCLLATTGYGLIAMLEALIVTWDKEHEAMV